jgi:hypothetical protein
MSFYELWFGKLSDALKIICLDGRDSWRPFPLDESVCLPEGWIKLNGDGAYKKSVNLVGCGGLLQDSDER